MTRGKKDERGAKAVQWSGAGNYHAVTRQRSRKRTGEMLRVRLAAWCEAHGGTRRSEDTYSPILGYTIGGTYVVPTSIGKLHVHLPADDVGHGFSINTRFLATTSAQLPRDANPHTGKWNFPCVDNADQLFETFTRSAERFVKVV